MHLPNPGGWHVRAVPVLPMKPGNYALAPRSPERQLSLCHEGGVSLRNGSSRELRENICRVHSEACDGIVNVTFCFCERLANKRLCEGKINLHRRGFTQASAAEIEVLIRENDSKLKTKE
jgi:hypothetical protein